MSKSQYNTNNAYELLIWQLEAGIDQCIGDEPNNRFNKNSENLESTEKKAVETTNRDSVQTIKNVRIQGDQGSVDAHNIQHSIHVSPASSNELALNCKSLEELEATVRDFDECALKKTSASTVFSSGSIDSRVMFVGRLRALRKIEKVAHLWVQAVVCLTKCCLLYTLTLPTIYSV